MSVDRGNSGFFATTLPPPGVCHRAVDYSAYILPAYAIAALLLGGLVLHTWMAARRAANALRAR